MIVSGLVSKLNTMKPARPSDRFSPRTLNRQNVQSCWFSSSDNGAYGGDISSHSQGNSHATLLQAAAPCTISIQALCSTCAVCYLNSSHSGGLCRVKTLFSANIQAHLIHQLNV